MKLKSAVIKNYRGIKEETLVSFQDFNCIVGKKTYECAIFALKL